MYFFHILIKYGLWTRTPFIKCVLGLNINVFKSGLNHDFIFFSLWNYVGNRQGYVWILIVQKQNQVVVDKQTAFSVQAPKCLQTFTHILQVYFSSTGSIMTMMGAIKWKHFLCYWRFVKGIHRWPVDSPQKDQWRRALMFSLICAWTNRSGSNRYAGDFRRYRL